MPTPEREAQPPQPQARPSSAVSMKDLLASCAAASAVSTPPRDEREGGPEDEAAEAAGAPETADAHHGERPGPPVGRAAA
ncbi:hypothetical protein [Streptomyces fulvorobeus]|uniref:Uncharacterized protein n=1 Tax=Streptomyces fulvorobeus TaxID=284028 RepID=A0A7J0C8Q5_9ACTN|nr:hypothetical protein [Streptomyces fulvorobeus]NYE42460.1 hypothetical protein [Streptomyces fulvorobeus]GFM98859.1 hypothetical protein Sfulv_36700 [Streptomyces fulvorobeus]